MKTITLFMFCLLYISPAYADYSKMNKALEDYTPPEYFFDVYEFETENRESAVELYKNTDDVLSSIENLKRFYEKKINEDREIPFLSGIDAGLFSKMANSSLDSEFVRKTVLKKIILQEIEVIAGLRNPAVLAAEKQVKAELESFNQVMDLDENLKQYSAFTEGIYTGIGPLKMGGSIKQKYPFPGLTSLKGRIIWQKVAVLMEKMRITQKNVITQTRKAYWNIVFVKQSMEITSETIEALNRLKGVATALYKSGKTSYQDIIKINIKLEILKDDLVTLSSKKKNIEVKLLELINLPANSKMGPVVLNNRHQRIFNPEALYSLARRNRQELKVTRHRIAKIQLMIEMSESMIREPFTLGFSTYEDEAVSTVGTGAGKFGFKEKTMASMKNKGPLKPWYGIDDPWLNQTKQKLSSLKQTLVKQENDTDTMVRNAWFEVDKNNRELNLYTKRILPLARSALDVTTREYEAGSILFSQVIDAHTYWLRAKLTIAKKQTDLEISTANLEKIIGISF